jgi:hypothetical protein
MGCHKRRELYYALNTGALGLMLHISLLCQSRHLSDDWTFGGIGLLIGRTEARVQLPMSLATYLP